jgi:hypothetical protein
MPALREPLADSFAADGIPAEHLAVVSGALDGIERVLGSQLRPGDRIGVEDPGFSNVLDLVAALGLEVVPVAIDDSGILPTALEAALEAGIAALIVTPRAQNPMGAALDADRTRALRRVLRARPDLLVVEDDHAGAVAGAGVQTLWERGRERWAVVRSTSKTHGPDLRLAALVGDAETMARVAGRQRIGWVSHLLQRIVFELESDATSRRRVQRRARTRSAVAPFGARCARHHGTWSFGLERLGARTGGGSRGAVAGGRRFCGERGRALPAARRSRHPRDDRDARTCSRAAPRRRDRGESRYAWQVGGFLIAVPDGARIRLRRNVLRDQQLRSLWTIRAGCRIARNIKQLRRLSDEEDRRNQRSASAMLRPLSRPAHPPGHPPAKDDERQEPLLGLPRSGDGGRARRAHR